MSKTLLEDLNPQQKEAVIYKNGPMIILAGAGSGKTRVLTYKVAYLLLYENLGPENILMVTFTNKAANEMKKRIIKLLGGLRQNKIVKNSKRLMPFTGTFHSLCAKILRKEGSIIGIPPNYLIFDEKDQLEVVKEALKILDISSKRFHPKSILTAISQAKNELISASEYNTLAQGIFQETVARVYFIYQKLLREQQGLDFDDLITETVNLFLNNKKLLQVYQEKYHYILIDEYQDTNHVQYALSKILSERRKNLCVVGDASQSIYAWRGANYRNITNIQTDFPEIKIFKLEQNYRSSQIILDAAHAVIKENTSHPILKLWTKRNSGEYIKLYEARNEQDEAMFVVNTISDLVKNNGFRLADSAVLYRTNAQSRLLEETCLKSGIPYVLVGGVRFYERREIKDVLSYLRFLINDKDVVSLRRIEKLGKKRLEKFFKWQKKIQKNNGLNSFSTIELLDECLKTTGYLDLFDKEKEEDAQRLENIGELRSVAYNFPNLLEFLENVALVEQEYLPQHPKDNTDKTNAITLMTLHAAKGLEFKAVFIIGLEEGLFPHSRSMLEKEELEEERRLCYVGMTRAKDQLYLVYARSRLLFGHRLQNPISRFATEIPTKLMLPIFFDY